MAKANVILIFDTEDYEIQVKGNDYASWFRLRERIGIDKILAYSRYASNTIGTLQLYDFVNKCMVEYPKNNEFDSHPVLFESNYSFSIKFKKELSDEEPQVYHAHKSVGDAFFFDNNFLYGNINFLNEPGKFDLIFHYKLRSGETKKGTFSFDVASAKMDVKSDLDTIIREINDDYISYFLKIVTLTNHQFDTGEKASLNTNVLLRVISDLIDDYLLAVRYITNRPHQVSQDSYEYMKVEKIKRWTPQLENEYWEDKEDPCLIQRKYYQVKSVTSTNDTRENQFVLYSLRWLSNVYSNVINEIGGDKNTAANFLDHLREQKLYIDTISKNPLFLNIGRFKGFQQESQVLLHRPGYFQIYQHWLTIQKGIELHNGNKSVGLLAIWQLYEKWCFIMIKRIVGEILQIEDPEFVENQSEGADKRETTFVYHLENGDKVTVGEQYTFNRDNFAAHNDALSLTSEQRPDIVLNIYSQETDMCFTYIFDAKYCVCDAKPDSKKQRDTNERFVDTPIPSNLDQMHSYRDAIIYRDSLNNNQLARQVVGAYILFPGRMAETSYAQMLASGENSDLLPYFLKSIRDVKIGAFPLMPNDEFPEEEGYLLKKYIESILKYTKDEHLSNTIPQRGLSY